MKKTTIDASLMAEIWLKWELKKGPMYFNCATGQKQENSEPWMRDRSKYDKNTHRLFNSGANIVFAYIKYHEDIECLEVAAVRMDSTRKPEPREWKYESKYFIKKDKTIYDENGVEQDKNGRFYVDKYHTAYRFSNYINIITRLHNNEKAIDEFKKFVGNNFYTIGNGRTIDIKWMWHIQDWYNKQTNKVRGAGKQQKLTDMLVELPHSDVSGLSERYPIKVIKDPHYSYRDIVITNIMYFERLIDGWSVIRMFNRNQYINTCHEIERMYLHDDGTNRIVCCNNGVWMPSKIHSSSYSTYYNFVNKDEAMEKCNRLKYIIPLFDKDENADKRIRDYIITTLYFPEVEQLMKLGYGTMAKYVATSNTPRAEMRNTFGGYYNEKETSLLRKVGLTKHQFDTYMKDACRQGGYGSYYFYTAPNTAIKMMRNFFEDEFIHLDNSSFDKYYNAFKKLTSFYRTFDKENIERLNVDYKRFVNNLIRLGEKNETAYNVVKDTISAYLNINNPPEINWYFDSYSDIVRAHDALDEIRRREAEERRALYNMAEADRLKKLEEKRIKIDKERKQYEYEDDSFIIRLPKDANEIVREGSMQRICIGGYAASHSQGHTNLFLLRKKSEPDVPFYAIEMKNNTIIQIHGFGNRWLGNNPEAIPTVVRWLRKNGISCKETILTCTSHGYCSNAHYIKMPVVD